MYIYGRACTYIINAGSVALLTYHTYTHTYIHTYIQGVIANTPEVVTFKNLPAGVYAIFANAWSINDETGWFESELTFDVWLGDGETVCAFCMSLSR